MPFGRQGPISKAIGSAVGITKEYQADRANRKAHEASASANENVPEPDENLDHEDFDDEEWAIELDEVQQQQQSISADTHQTEKDAGDFVAKFAAQHPPKGYHNGLPMPVVLPQRRPESRHRGFIRAYAPVLEEVGIDEATWLEFLGGFEEAIKNNPWFHTANVAVWVADKVNVAVTGFSPIAMAVSMTIHVSVETARRGYIHSKQNTYIDQMNEKFFKPRGLFCLVITYKPSSNEPVETIDVNRNIAETVSKRESEERSKWKNVVSGSAATTKHEAEIPEFAPLVFPELDKMNDQQKENSMKHFGHFLADYFDRQSQAKYTAAHPDSKLNVAPEKEWASEYSDPNSAVRQGGLITMATGGKVNRPPLIRGRLVRGRGRLGILGRQTNRKEGKQNRKSKLPMKRLLKSDACYLMVVNMPTQEELDAVAKVLEEN